MDDDHIPWLVGCSLATPVQQQHAGKVMMM
jgi:hypothetical protein